MLYFLIHWPFLFFFQGRVEDRHHAPDTCASGSQEPSPMLSKAHDMGFLRTYGKLNKWLNDVKGVMGTRCVGYTSNFEVLYAQVHFSVRWVWVCPYRVVSWLISDWWKVLIVPPVTKIWHKHHEDGSSTLKYLRRNCVLSSPYRQSEGFCTVSARVPSAAIKCSFGAEELADTFIKFCKRIPW